MIRKIAFILLFSFTNLWLFAQNTTTDSAEMADAMRSNGKIYVVVAVIVTIFAGLIIYLVRLDRKINKLEKEKLNPNS